MNTTLNTENGTNQPEKPENASELVIDLVESVSQIPPSKKWWQSRTVWVNIAAIVAAITAHFGMPIYIEPELAMTLYPLILGVVNLILRGTTNKGIEPPIHLRKPSI